MTSKKLFVYLVKTEHAGQSASYLCQRKSRSILEKWKRKSGRGDVDYFRGKDVYELGDDTYIPNSMLKSRAVWNPKGALEIYIRVKLRFRPDEVKTAKAVSEAFKKEFNAERMLCDVTRGKFSESKGCGAYTVSWFGKVAERPSEEKISKCRSIVEDAAVEATLQGFNKTTGETVEYLYSELPYTTKEKRFIMLNADAERLNEKQACIKGYLWKYA